MLLGNRIWRNGPEPPNWTDPAAEPIAQQRAAVQAALADTAISTVLGPFRFTADHDVDQIVWIVEANAQGHRLVGFCDPDCGAQ